MAKTIHGEAGICDRIQKEAVAWCIINRVECEWFPDNIIDVIIEPYQFHGYSPDKKPTQEEYDIAFDVIFRWMNGSSDRLLPKEYLFFYAKNGKNVFTTKFKGGKIWNAES